MVIEMCVGLIEVVSFKMVVIRRIILEVMVVVSEDIFEIGKVNCSKLRQLNVSEGSFRTSVQIRTVGSSARLNW